MYLKKGKATKIFINIRNIKVVKARNKLSLLKYVARSVYDNRTSFIMKYKSLIDTNYNIKSGIQY